MPSPIMRCTKGEQAFHILATMHSMPWKKATSSYPELEQILSQCTHVGLECNATPLITFEGMRHAGFFTEEPTPLPAELVPMVETFKAMTQTTFDNHRLTAGGIELILTMTCFLGMDYHLQRSKKQLAFLNKGQSSAIGPELERVTSYSSSCLHEIKKAIANEYQSTRKLLAPIEILYEQGKFADIIAMTNTDGVHDTSLQEDNATFFDSMMNIMKKATQDNLWLFAVGLNHVFGENNLIERLTCQGWHCRAVNHAQAPKQPTLFAATKSNTEEMFDHLNIAEAKASPPSSNKLAK